MASIRETDNEVRKTALEKLKVFLEQEYGEVYVVPASKGATKDAYALACPCLSADGTEKVIRIEVNVPRGERGKRDYNPYQESEDFLASLT